MPIDYDNRYFRAASVSEGGEVDARTLFHYRHQGNIVWGTYQGGGVVFGVLTAVVDVLGRLDMRYQQVASDGSIKTGQCASTPEVLPDGRLRLHETWRWTEGASGEGTSVVEEVEAPAGPPTVLDVRI
jgi:hypothetical protein